MALYSALVKGFFAEEGLSVQGMRVDVRSAIEQGKPHFLWLKTDKGLSEADFGFLDIDQLHHLAAGKIDYYIVDGMNFGCMEIMVAPDSPLKSAADLKGKKVEMNPWWVAPFRAVHGLTFVNQELKASGVDPASVTLATMPWEALPKMSEYVTEGFKTGKFQAVGLTEPDPLILRERKLARPLFTQTYQAPYNQEYCCLLGIKREIVDKNPEKAALIVRAFRRAKQWTAQNPSKAVIAAQASGYYPPAAPVEASANRVVSFGFDRRVDLAQSLERSFQERIDAGAIRTTKSAKELVRIYYRPIEQSATSERWRASGATSQTAQSETLRPSAEPGRCTPQAASLASTVFRWTPSSRAPRLTFQPTRSSTRSTYWRSNCSQASRRGRPVSSARREPVSGNATSSGMSCRCNTGSRASTTARWMTFSSSRTFPGQS
jgi:NitT/TauT family transport system substrate-binding protein